MPTAEFFEMINKTFDDNTINEVLDLIVDSVKTEEINKSIKNSITNFYQGKSRAAIQSSRTDLGLRIGSRT